MKGTMVTIPVDEAEPALVEELSRPPDLMTLFKAVGGLVEQVPYLTSYEDADLSPYEHVGTLVRCVAFRNTDAHSQGQPINERAQGIWMKSLLRQRRERSHHAGDVLCGPVVILYGDNEFMGRLS
jgi:hypothetical protein